MKKILILVLIIIPLFVFGVLIYRNQTTTPSKSSAANLDSSDVDGSKENNFMLIDNRTFAWFEVSDTDRLKLLPNFTEKVSSRDAITDNNCKFLSSAGFYSKDDKPLGLFITESNTLSEFQNNSLFDGILSINDIRTPRITRNIPQDSLKNAVQSGPILKENGSFQPLRIMNDTESRRVVAAVTGENKLYFMIVYNTNSEFTGPLLADLPNVLKGFEEKTGITFADAINLDGGSASAFYNGTKNLSEINSVGAFFCQL